jgi:hypothetical protein
MTAKWGSCAILVICFGIMFGCRTPQPNLKPEKVPEQLVSPPDDSRFGSPTYPDQAFDKPADPAKALMDAKNAAGGMPSRGSMAGGGGPGGVPGR